MKMQMRRMHLVKMKEIQKMNPRPMGMVPVETRMMMTRMMTTMTTMMVRKRRKKKKRKTRMKRKSFSHRLKSENELESLVVFYYLVEVRGMV